MDREKLEKASDDFANSIPDIGGGEDFTIWHVMDAFKSGAEWLQSQPIADRLTETEREKIRDIYWQAMKDWIGIGDARGYCRTCIAIESIFGKEMFKK